MTNVHSKLFYVFHCIIWIAPSLAQAQPFWEATQNPLFIGKAISNEIFTRPEFMMYSTPELTAVHYAEICAAFGAARFAAKIKDRKLLQKIVTRYSADTIPNPGNHVDANVYGILPLQLYLWRKDKYWLKKGLALADKQWDDPLPNGLTQQTRYWIDDVFMIGCLQTQAYRATKDKKYIQRAALEINSYIQKLQQPNGLFFHGENAPFYWGRGNGWVAAGIAEVISELPKTNEYYPAILKGYTRMMEALIKYQGSNGMWKQLIDYDSAWDETSATAMFGYAIAVGVKKGILKDLRYKIAYQNAWKALTTYLNKDGKMTEVCAGTGQSKEAAYYLNRPRVVGDFHGQAPMLWFAYILL